MRRGKRFLSMLPTRKKLHFFSLHCLLNLANSHNSKGPEKFRTFGEWLRAVAFGPVKSGICLPLWLQGTLKGGALRAPVGLYCLMGLQARPK